MSGSGRLLSPSLEVSTTSIEFRGGDPSIKLISTSLNETNGKIVVGHEMFEVRLNISLPEGLLRSLALRLEFSPLDLQVVGGAVIFIGNGITGSLLSEGCSDCLQLQGSGLLGFEFGDVMSATASNNSLVECELEVQVTFNVKQRLSPPETIYISPIAFVGNSVMRQGDSLSLQRVNPRLDIAVQLVGPSRNLGGGTSVLIEVSFVTSLAAVHWPSAKVSFPGLLDFVQTAGRMSCSAQSLDRNISLEWVEMGRFVSAQLGPSLDEGQSCKLEILAEVNGLHPSAVAMATHQVQVELSWEAFSSAPSVIGGNRPTYFTRKSALFCTCTLPLVSFERVEADIASVTVLTIGSSIDLVVRSPI